MSDQERKVCPIGNVGLCVEKRCAWWNHIDEECCIATLGTLATIEIGGSGRKND